MSILNPAPVPVDPAAVLANSFREHARNTYQQLIRTFNGTAQEFWRNPHATPQAIAAALGTDAVEVFRLHGQIGALLAAVSPEMIAAGLAVVGEFTYNDDGTVTIVENAPEEAPVSSEPIQPPPVTIEETSV